MKHLKYSIIASFVSLFFSPFIASAFKNKSVTNAPADVKECLKSIGVGPKTKDISKKVFTETLADGSTLCYVRSQNAKSTHENQLTITKGPLIIFKDDTFAVKIAKDKKSVLLNVDTIDAKKSTGIHSFKNQKVISIKKCNDQHLWSDQCPDKEFEDFVQEIRDLKVTEPDLITRKNKFVSLLSPDHLKRNVCPSQSDIQKKGLLEASLASLSVDNETLFVLRCKNGQIIENISKNSDLKISEINCNDNNVATHEGEPHNPHIYYDLDSCLFTRPKPDFKYTSKMYKEFSFEKNGFSVKGEFKNPVKGYFKWSIAEGYLENEQGWKLSFYTEDGVSPEAQLKDGIHLVYKLTKKQIAILEKNPEMVPDIYYVSGYSESYEYQVQFLTTKFDRKNFQLEAIDKTNNPLEGFYGIDASANGNIIYLIRFDPTSPIGLE